MQSLSGLLDLFLESGCSLCQRSSPGELCQGCQRQIQRCRGSDAQWQEPLPLLAWGVYGGTLKRAIATLKYENQPRLARPLGHWLAQAWLESPQAKTRQQQLTVVPLPMYAVKKRQRGYDQAELLAKYFCEVAGLTLRQQGLERIRATEAQFTLSATEREQNLSDAFCLGKEFQRRRPPAVLLLDDVYTTGATARAAMQILRHHAIDVVGMVAIAKPTMNSENETQSKLRQLL